MAIELSTAGIKVKYAVESTAGTRPTTGYKMIRGVKSIPEFGGEPETLETTTLDKEKYKTYIPALQDPGGAIGLTVNFYEDFWDDWDDLCDDFATAQADNGKSVWIEYAIPGMKSFYYQAKPTPISFGGAEVNSVLEATAYVTPTSEPVWENASTDASNSSEPPAETPAQQ